KSRGVWRDDPDFRVHRKLGPEYDRLKERCDQTLAALDRLPVSDDIFDLTHNDVHPGNFFIDNGRMTVFDFDDCHYDFLVNDLAIALFYALRDARVDQDDRQFARTFWDNLLNGYHEKHSLPKAQFDHVPLFLKLREFLLYALLQIEAPDSDSPWCVRFMTNRKERIENAVPVIDIDFNQ
ncbi:phosphotransferase, partial [candidate division GN15 bacterium]|nr:phosphotransferase [candidate division GN15 bacterium]